jgi:hypothetical protein
MPSNIITPPDFVENENTNILIIDAELGDIENITLYLQTCFQYYNVYLYRDVMLDPDWLTRAIQLASSIIINTEESACQSAKNQLLQDPRTWYYGPQQFLGNRQKLSRPLEYFLK